MQRSKRIDESRLRSISILILMKKAICNLPNCVQKERNEDWRGERQRYRESEEEEEQ